MIFGDPYYFGSWLDRVAPWNLSNLGTEGVFAIFINGYLIPSQLPDKSTFLDNSFKSINHFLELIDNLENEDLFNMHAKDRFEFLMSTVHYQNKNLSEEDSFLYWHYCLTDYIDSPSDKDDIWYVAYGDKEKLLYFQQESIQEIELPKGTVKSTLIDVIRVKEEILW